MVRQEGLEVCQSVIDEDIHAIEPYLDEIVEHAADDDITVALRTLELLDTVVNENPDMLEGELSPLVEALNTEHTNIQSRGGRLLARLVVDRPSFLTPHVRGIVEALEATELDSKPRQFDELTGDPVTRQTLQEHEETERKRRISSRRTLINVVVAITETAPGSVSGTVDGLAELLDDTDPAIVGGAVDALGEIAARDPSAVVPVRGRLVDCLDHGRTVVRARAVRALGRLGDDSAVPKLRSVVESDDDEDVRELAAETADFLSSGS
ncbi:Adaptin protein [Halococcus hamelinensis 100A6]|uniref:Adaptin protein n=1 Tax=Halococcus hamelinensis 100A6 TaxID=1132509 RepID=M0LY62_9EURY|nr:Adaptin protein [Halococcus hamelinensis 100A6]